MSLPSFTMRELMEAGIHFGHNPRRWNPKMAPYLYGVRNGIHIINLEKTVPMLYQAMEALQKKVSQGGRVLFVGTKRQASHPFAEAAKKCGQYYVNHRWLGGMLTNWKTISNSIDRLKELTQKLESDITGLTKKEQLTLERQINKLDRALGGIKEMGGVPDILFVVDTIREVTAIKEARKLGIPIIAVVDSNSDPDLIDYPIPGNDDALRSIELYCHLMSGTILEGLQNQMLAAGVDLGASENFPPEEISVPSVDSLPPQVSESLPQTTASSPALDESKEKKLESNDSVVSETEGSEKQEKKSSPQEALSELKKDVVSQGKETPTLEETDKKPVEDKRTQGK